MRVTSAGSGTISVDGKMIQQNTSALGVIYIISGKYLIEQISTAWELKNINQREDVFKNLQQE